MFSAFKKFYLTLKFRFTPRFFVKNITFGPRSRHSKIPLAAVANQIVAKARIPPAHVQKKMKGHIFLSKKTPKVLPVQQVSCTYIGCSLQEKRKQYRGINAKINFFCPEIIYIFYSIFILSLITLIIRYKL